MRRLSLLFLLLALAQCAPPPPLAGQARADAATRAACREHADAVYNRQNRDEIYSISNRDVPSSSNYVPGTTDRGLADRYVHDNMIRDCIRNTGTETSRTSQQQAPAPAAQTSP